MKIIKKWFQAIFNRLMPSPSGNAWDEYKRSRVPALTVAKRER